MITFENIDSLSYERIFVSIAHPINCLLVFARKKDNKTDKAGKCLAAIWIDFPHLFHGGCSARPTKGKLYVQTHFLIVFLSYLQRIISKF